MGCDNLDAWAAGFIDGEGYLAIIQRKPGLYQGRVEVAQTRREPLERLQVLFGGRIVKLRPREGRRPTWRWDMSAGSEIAACLRRIRPFLIVKGDEADILLEFAETVGVRGLHTNEATKQNRERLRLSLLETRG